MPTSFDRELGPQASGPDPGLLTAARRHPPVVLAAVLVAVTLAALITLAMPVKYTTRAQVVLGDQNDSTVFRNVAGLNPTAKAQSAAQVMRSEEVYDRASDLLAGKVSADRIQNSVNI